jgi:hypothetical protein
MTYKTNRKTGTVFRMNRARCLKCGRFLSTDTYCHWCGYDNSGITVEKTSKLKRYWQVFVIFHDEEREWEQEFGTAESDFAKAQETEAKAKEFYPTARTEIRPLDLETEY